jgi:tetratricopeptide (TPR) repeat protein
VNVIGTYTVTVDAGEDFETASQNILIDELLLAANGKTDGNSTWVNIYLKTKNYDVVYKPSILDAKMANVPPKAFEPYNKGLKHASENKYADAEKELRKAISAYPSFYQAQTELGKIYMKLGRFDEAVVALRLAIATEPGYPPAQLHLGIALLNLKKLDEALPAFVRAAELESADPTPNYYVGVIKYETGGTDEAIASFEKARELKGSKPFPMLHKYLASLYLKKNLWTPAVAEMEKYLEQSPDAADAGQIRKLLGEARSRIK